jgi:hypothetical protein
MSSTPALQAKFFVIRPNGSIIPLIAMDEVPTTVLIRDVPRKLEFRDTVDMVNVGEHESRHEYHEVSFTGIRGFNPPPTDNPQASAQAAPSSAAVHQSNGLNMDLGYPAPPRTFSIGEQASDSNTASPSTTDTNGARVRPLPEWHAKSSIPRAPGVKKFCTNWLWKGECAFVQQGCRYLHVMPATEEGLHAVGLLDWPDWYREQHQIGSLLAVPGSGVRMPRKEKLKHIDESKDWRAKQR